MQVLRRPWILAGLLAGVHILRLVCFAMTVPLSRFDEGIYLSATTFLAKGLVLYRDFYQPYGPALGFVGLPARLLTGDEIFPLRLWYGLPAVALTLFGSLILARRRSPWAAAVFGLITLAVPLLASYALCYLAFLALFVLVDTGCRRAGGELISAARQERTILSAGGVIFALAAWVRPEYAVFPVLWGALCWRLGVSLRQALSLVGVSVAVASLPYVLIALMGGLSNMLTFANYSIFGFRNYRGLPFDLGFVPEGIRTLTGTGTGNGVIPLLCYLPAAALLLLSAGSLLQRRSLFEPDRTGLSAFCALFALAVTAAQSTRFDDTHAAQAVPLVWLALLLGWPRHQRVRFTILATGSLLVVPLLVPPAPVAAAGTAWKETVTEPVVKRLHRAPLNHEDRLSLALLASAWHDRAPRGSQLFTLNRRNDRTFVNEAFLYWFLDADPAAWMTTFDPGLSDRDSIQKGITRDLCRSHPAIVQLTRVRSQTEFAPSDHASRYLDQFVALNYRAEFIASPYRLLLPEDSACRFPEDAGRSSIRSRRNVLVRRDDISEAGALGVLSIDRDLRSGRNTDTDDVAVAILGGYWVPDEALPEGPPGRALRALRDQERSVAIDPADFAETSDLTRLAGLRAWIDAGPTSPSTQDQDLVTRLAEETLGRGGGPLAVRIALEASPTNSAVLDRLEAIGGPTVDIERARLRLAVRDAGFDPLEKVGRHVLGDFEEAPVERADLLHTVARAYEIRGKRSCAEALHLLAVPFTDDISWPAACEPAGP